MKLDTKHKTILGRLIQETRVSHQIRQKDLAMELGLTTPQYISNVERGTATPSIELLLALITLTNLKGASKDRFISKVTKIYGNQVKEHLK